MCVWERVGTMPRSNDVKLDSVTFNTLVRGWCNRGDMKMATTSYLQLAHTGMDRVEEDGSCDGLV